MTHYLIVALLCLATTASPTAATGAKRAPVLLNAVAARGDTTGARRRQARPLAPDTARVELEVAGGGSAFVAYPAGSGRAPGIILVHEWWGLNGQIREVARRLARQGYVAIVPDLYHGKVANDAEGAHVLARGLDEADALAQLEAASNWLAAAPRSVQRRRGVIGFCMGGHLALRIAVQDTALAGIVMFYGAPESRPERIAALHAALLGHFGADDQGIDVGRVETFERVLKAAGKDAEVYVYSGAGHAFMNEEQPGYWPEAARLAWVRTLDFLQVHLKARP